MTTDGLILFAATGWALAGVMVLVAAYFAGEANAWKERAIEWQKLFDEFYEPDKAYEMLMRTLERKQG